jgi:hypothetical protein
MTDHFEKAMADIATKRTGNGGPKIDDVLQALRATNEDADETAAALAKKVDVTRATLAAKVEVTHKETLRWHDKLLGMLAEHVDESKVRDRRIADLEIAQVDRRQNCIPEMTRLIASEHDIVHANYVASLEPDKRSFAQILAAWSAGKKALAIIATALLIGLTGIGVSYIGSYFSANKTDQTVIHDEATPTPTPTVTITILPAP